MFFNGPSLCVKRLVSGNFSGVGISLPSKGRGSMADDEWVKPFSKRLAIFARRNLTPLDVAQAIHEALEIAEATKYATSKSRFSFSLSGATQDDVIAIRAHLTRFENVIVELITDSDS
jgi:hypothetical protein